MSSTKSTISRSRSIIPRSLSLMLLVRQCTATNERVVPTTPGNLNVTVNTPASSHTFPSVPAQVSPPTIPTTLNSVFAKTTVVSQPPAPSVRSLWGDVLSAAKGAIKAPMPGLVVEMRVEVGDRVEEGQAVAVLESMKVETVLRADVAGVVTAIEYKNGEMVEKGKELVVIEADSESS